MEGGNPHNGFPGDLSNNQDTFVALDLNGDGKSDFLEYRPGSGYTIKCLSNGDGTVNCIFLSQRGQQYNGFKDSMTNGAQRIVAMDLNRDGRFDFIVYTPVKRLATDLQGGVWVVDGSQGTASAYGRLIHYDANGQNATITDRIAQDVAVGKNGSFWGTDQYGVFEVSGRTDGGTDLRSVYTTRYGTHVAVDNQGFPWVIDTNGYIQKFNGSIWQQVSGAQGKEIVAAADGSIFIVGYNTPSIGRYNVQNNNFDFLQMDADHIAVEPGGQPWAIRQGTGTVYKGSLDQM